MIVAERTKNYRVELMQYKSATLRFTQGRLHGSYIEAKQLGT